VKNQLVRSGPNFTRHVRRPDLQTISPSPRCGPSPVLSKPKAAMSISDRQTEAHGNCISSDSRVSLSKHVGGL